MRQRKTNTVYYHLYVESKKYRQTSEFNNKTNRFTDTENKLVVTGGEREGRMGKIGVQD